jgi:protein required for attachment to host cells
MMKRMIIWYVVADGGRARIVRKREDGERFETFQSMESVDIHHHSHDIGPDKPGRVFERAVIGRHAIEPRDDPHEAAKRAFAYTVSSALNEAAKQGDYHGLVLVAPARILQYLRDGLSAAAIARLKGELPKDLTQIKDSDLARHFAELKLN